MITDMEKKAIIERIGRDREAQLKYLLTSKQAFLEQKYLLTMDWCAAELQAEAQLRAKYGEDWQAKHGIEYRSSTSRFSMGVSSTWRLSKAQFLKQWRIRPWTTSARSALPKRC